MSCCSLSTKIAQKRKAVKENIRGEHEGFLHTILTQGGDTYVPMTPKINLTTERNY